MPEKLNSFDALKAKKQEVLAGQQAQVENVEVRVAMATCAIATGAKEVLEAVERTVQNEGLINVTVKPTGCMGYCFAEPTVEVVRAGEAPVMYGRVDAAAAMDIVIGHVKNGQTVTNFVLPTRHVNA